MTLRLRGSKTAIMYGANVFLRDMDELKELAEQQRQAREAVVGKVEEIAACESEKFMGWWASQEVVPTIKDLKSMAEAIRRDEVDKVLRRSNGLSIEDRTELDWLTSAIVNKILHGPVVRLKSGQDGHSYVRVLRELFQLSDSRDIDAGEHSQV